MGATNTKLAEAIKAILPKTDRGFFLWGDALNVVAEELARDPKCAAALRDVLVEHLPADDEAISLGMSAASRQSWANTVDRTARTRPAREGLLRRFEREVDPNNTLPPAERARRAESARKAFYAELAAKSVAARHRNAAKRADGLLP